MNWIVSFQMKYKWPANTWKNSNIVSIKDMKIRTTSWFHLIPVIITIMKKTNNSKCWRWCEEKRILLHSFWNCKLMKPTTESGMKSPQEAKNRTIIWPSDTRLYLVSRVISQIISQHSIETPTHPCFCSIICNSQAME
jgi:hypothetical protein